MPRGIPNKSPVNLIEDDFVSREDILQSYSSRDERVDEQRAPRPVDRDVEEIIMPDGKKFTRVARTSVRNDNPSLSSDSKAGWKRRWISGAKPGRLQEVIDLGYIPATDENGTAIKPRKGGYKDGQMYQMYLMEISEEMDAKLERDNAEKVSNLNQKVINENVGQSLGHNSSTYLAQDDFRSVTKQN
jgi:hypothetical protein